MSSPVLCLQAFSFTARMPRMGNVLNALPAVHILLLVSLVVIFAAAVQAALGMGYGLMAAPILMLIEPAYVPAPTILVGMMTSALGSYRERQHIQWREVLTASGGRITGVLLALLILASVVSTAEFKLAFGVLVAAAVALTAIGWRLRQSAASLISMGILSGCMGTITGVGAPPMAIVYQDRPSVIARPTLAAFFFIGCATSAIGLAFIGWLGWRELLLALTMAPALLVGTWIGRQISNAADQRYRPLLLGLAGMASVILIIQGFIEWGREV